LELWCLAGKKWSGAVFWIWSCVELSQARPNAARSTTASSAPGVHASRLLQHLMHPLVVHEHESQLRSPAADAAAFFAAAVVVEVVPPLAWHALRGAALFVVLTSVGAESSRTALLLCDYARV
jgi:hypothetical protein